MAAVQAQEQAQAPKGRALRMQRMLKHLGARRPSAAAPRPQPQAAAHAAPSGGREVAASSSALFARGGAYMSRQLLAHSCPGNLTRSCVHNVNQTTTEGFLKYWKYNKEKKIEGWVAQTILVINYHLAQYQHSKCMSGSAVEIGVHHGKHILALAAVAAPGEKALAMDLFEDAQKLNVDNSGSGSKARLLNHTAELGLTNLHTLACDSMAMTIHNISAYLPARVFSIDGGHYAQATLSDMLLASCAVGREGYFLVDDFINEDWVGVAEGVFRFMHTHSDHGPFFWGCNKVLFAHRDVHAQYLAVVKQLPFLRCTSGKAWHHTRYTLYGYQVCVHAGDCEIPFP